MNSSGMCIHFSVLATLKTGGGPVGCHRMYTHIHINVYLIDSHM